MADVSALTEQGTTRPFLIVRGTDVTGVKPPTGYLITFMHCMKGVVGSGIFALGYAFMHCGILLGPLLLVVIALMLLHCQHLLIRACVRITEKEPVPVLPTFAETVQYTLEDSSSNFLKSHSQGFAIMTDVFLVTAEYGVCVVYFIFVARHFNEIAAAYGFRQDYRLLLALFLVPMWLSTFLGNLKLLMPVSTIANFITWTGIVLVLYYALEGEMPPLNERELVAKVEKLPIYVGIVLFAMAGITFIIPVRMEMKNPDSFTSTFGVMNVTMIVVAILYTMVGFFTYWKWGDEVKGSAFINMPQDEPLSQATKIIIALGVMLTYALHMYIPFEILYPRFHRRWGPFKHPTRIMYIYKSMAVILTYGLANISSKLGAFISLVGSLTGAVLALFVPALLELVMLYGQLTHFIIIKDVLLIIVSIAAGITGTILAVIDIINDYIEE